MHIHKIVYGCTDLHTYIHTYIHACIHTYINTYIHTYIHTYLRTYIHTYIHTYTKKCLQCRYAYMSTSMHTYAHTHEQTYLFTCMHAFMHHAYMPLAPAYPKPKSETLSTLYSMQSPRSKGSALFAEVRAERPQDHRQQRCIKMLCRNLKKQVARGLGFGVSGSETD